jgi:hypothetical protein
VSVPVLFTLRGSAAGHGHGLATCIGRLEELAQTLLEHHDTLCAGSVAHADDGAPEVESVGDVTTDTEEDQEDKVERVAEDCLGSLVNGRDKFGKRETYLRQSRSSQERAGDRRSKGVLG